MPEPQRLGMIFHPLVSENEYEASNGGFSELLTPES